MKWQQKYTGTMNRFSAFNGVFVVYFVGIYGLFGE